MAKKDFKDAASASAAAFESIAKGAVRDTQDSKDAEETQDTQGALYVHDTQPAKKPQKAPIIYARMNLKIPAIYKEYLQAAAYRESSPTKIVSVTEYICRLLDKDMEEHNYKGLENEKENTNS